MRWTTWAMAVGLLGLLAGGTALPGCKGEGSASPGSSGAPSSASRRGWRAGNLSSWDLLTGTGARPSQMSEGHGGSGFAASLGGR